MVEAKPLAEFDAVIQPYKDSDRDACVAMSIEAWPRMSSGLPGNVASDFWGMLLDLSRDYSDSHEVACVSGSVAGVLFGRRRGSLSRREAINQARIFLSAMNGIRRKCSFRELISLFSTLMLTEIKVFFNTPACDGEIVFFVVDPRCQGSGIGNLLLESYLAHAMMSGLRRVSVYTTDPACNWGFYERRGFRRVARFGDDFGAHIEGEGSTGLMYVLELDGPGL